MDDFEEECSIDLAAVLQQQANVGQLVNLKNISYQVPNVPLSQWSIKIYYNGEWLDFSPHYAVAAGAMSGSDRAGFEVSTCRFALEDTADPSNLPLNLTVASGLNRLKVEVLNKNQTYRYFRGYVESAKPAPLLQRSSDFSDQKYINVSCVDETAAFRRVPIDEVYENVTESFMISDLIARLCPEFDVSGINTALGGVVAHRSIIGRYLSEFIKDVLERNGWTLWLDIQGAKTKVYLGEKGNSAIALPVSINDQMLYQYFNNRSFWINTSVAAYRNRVRASYRKLYNKGTVNVAQNTKIVFGFGTAWYGKLFPGDSFRLPGSQSTYTIESNPSLPDTSIEELHLSGEFKESTATGVPYEAVSSEPDTLVVENVLAIQALASIVGETGEFAGVREYIAPITDSNAYTEEEMLFVAESLLRMNVYEGGAATDNYKFPYRDVRGGRTIELDCPEHGVKDNIVFQMVNWRDGRAYLPMRTDGREDPYILYDLSFTDRLFAVDNQMQAILLQLRRPQSSDKEKIKVYKTLPEQLVLGDCFSVSEGSVAIEDTVALEDTFEVIEQTDMDDSELTVSDTLTAAVAPTGPWYWVPAPMGGADLIWCSVDAFSRWN